MVIICLCRGLVFFNWREEEDRADASVSVRRWNWDGRGDVEVTRGRRWKGLWQTYGVGLVFLG